MTSVVVTQTTINASVVQESVSVSVTSSPINVTISPVDINSHSAVTIGTANGLSLSGQVLSLGLSSALATGALSSTDWSTFNNKQNALGYTPVNIASAEWIDLTDGGATILHSHAGSGAVWGAITGTLSNQTDLQAALDAKQDDLTFPIASTLGGTGVNNAGTLTNASNTTITGGGTVALGGFTLTVPASLTVAGLAVQNVFSVAQNIVVADALTATAATILTLDHTTSGTAADSFGSQILFRLESSTGSLRNAGSVYVDWQTATDASRAGRMMFGVDNAGTMQFPFSMTKTGIIFNATGAGNGDVILSIADGGADVLRVTKNSANGAVRVFQTYTSRTALIVSGVAGATEDLQRWQNSAAVVLGSIGLSGVVLHSPVTTTTNAVLEVMKLQANVSTAATGSSNGFGTGLSWYAETATDTTNQQQGLISTSWVDATNASRKAKMSLSAYDTAARLGIEIEASGTAAKLGFYGATSVIRATTAGAASTFVANTSAIADDTATFDGFTIGQVVKALRNIGILT